MHSPSIFQHRPTWWQHTNALDGPLWLALFGLKLPQNAQLRHWRLTQSLTTDLFHSTILERNPAAGRLKLQLDVKSFKSMHDKKTIFNQPVERKYQFKSVSPELRRARQHIWPHFPRIAWDLDHHLAMSEDNTTSADVRSMIRSCLYSSSIYVYTSISNHRGTRCL